MLLLSTQRGFLEFDRVVNWILDPGTSQKSKKSFATLFCMLLDPAKPAFYTKDNVTVPTTTDEGVGEKSNMPGEKIL